MPLHPCANPTRRKLIKDTIDDYWLEHRRPPTRDELRNLTGIKTMTIITYYLLSIPTIRLDNRGKIVPQWVDAMFEAHAEAYRCAGGDVEAEETKGMDR